MTTAVDAFHYLTDLELLTRYATLVAEAEQAVEHGASERRELEVRQSRDEVAVAVLARMGRQEER